MHVLYPDLMLDLETLSSARNAPILQIGAVAFNIKTGDIHPKKLSVNVRPDFNITPPSFDTVLWWMHQSDEAKQSVFADDDRMDPLTAMYTLMDFINFRCTPDVNVWAMPPEFDCAILDNTRLTLGIKPLWKYDKTRDLRTLEMLAGGDKTTRFPPAIQHDAAEDALAQAMTACHYYKRLFPGNPVPVGQFENIGSMSND